MTAAMTLADAARLRNNLLRLTRRLRRRSGADLTPAQLSALATLDRHGVQRLGDFTRREQISKSSGTSLVVRLEELGLVRRLADLADGRSWRIELTDTGREVLARSNERADGYLVQQVAALTSDDQRRLLAVLPVLDRLLAMGGADLGAEQESLLRTHARTTRGKA